MQRLWRDIPRCIHCARIAWHGQLGASTAAGSITAEKAHCSAGDKSRVKGAHVLFISSEVDVPTVNREAASWRWWASR